MRILSVVVASCVVVAMKLEFVHGRSIDRKHRYTQGTRQSQMDSSGLICNVGPNYEASEEMIQHKFPYWYAMGTRGVVDAMEMLNLELLLLRRVQGNLVWCWENDGANASNGGRQLLEGSTKSLIDPQTRRLGIISLTIGDMDEQTEYQCPKDVESMINATHATGCKTVKGQMSILALPSDDVSYAIAGIRDGLERVMRESQATGLPGVPDVAFLVYLGDSEEDAISFTSGTGNNGDGGIIIIEGSGSTGGSGGSGGGGETDGNDDITGSGTTVGGGDGNENGTDHGDGSRGGIDTTGGTPISEEVTTNDKRDDDDPLGLVLAIGVPLLLLLIIAAMFAGRKRKAQPVSQYRDMLDSQFVLVGTGDPPGSFHEGLYHYMRNGTRYLSTRCEGCLETRKNCFYTDNNLGTILEDEIYQEDILLSPDSHHVSKKHTGIDVHKCTSATCDRCNSRTYGKDTFFVPSPRYGDDDDDDFVYSDVYRIAGYDYSAEHAEV